jgi:uncharacterized membrane protein (UPF0127 family)
MNLKDLEGKVSLWAAGECVLDSLTVARDWRTRVVGLMFQPQVPSQYGQGLLFPSCRSLHTFQMRFPLDIAFLDAEGQPLAIRRMVQPWKVVTGPRGTRHCLEVASGGFPEGVPLVGWNFKDTATSS